MKYIWIRNTGGGGCEEDCNGRYGGPHENDRREGSVVGDRCATTLNFNVKKPVGPKSFEKNNNKNHILCKKCSQ